MSTYWKHFYIFRENTPKKLAGMKKPVVEDSLENTFSCVPKVQGESRISQANGQRRE